MILAALILQAAAPESAVDAERAFNAAAQARGQWTAFREYVAANATMFVPQPINAQEWLKDRKDPAKSVEWWPSESYVSCDGNTAINTGGWKRPDGSVGYFTTIWRRQADGGWKWVYDGGDTLASPLPVLSEPKLIRPECVSKSPMYMMAAVPNGAPGASSDYSMMWEWSVAPNGERHLRVTQWDGQRHKGVLSQTVAPAK